MTKVTILLTLMGIFNNIASITPPISYLTKLDIWNIVCLLHVFFVLVEYPIVLALKNRHEFQKDTEDEKQELKPTAAFSPANTKEKIVSFKASTLKLANDIEKCTKIIYPLSFALFNIAYWFFIIQN